MNKKELLTVALNLASNHYDEFLYDDELNDVLDVLMGSADDYLNNSETREELREFIIDKCISQIKFMANK